MAAKTTKATKAKKAKKAKKLAIPRFIDSPKNHLPWGDFGIRHGA